MEILIINKFFYEKGGAETYSFALKELLIANGHKVIDFSMDHKENTLSPYSKYFVKEINYHKGEAFYKQLNKGGKFLYSLEAKRKLKMLIKMERPDIVHIQNYRHQLTVSVIKVLLKEKIPIVHTIHDLQLLCGNYQMLSHGKLCENCKKGKHYHCLLNRCVNNSKTWSALSMTEMYVNKLLLNRNDWAYFIAPSNFFKRKFIEHGYPEDRIYTIPNFLEIENYEPCYEDGDYFIYLGRLSEEKGLFTLLKAMSIVTGAKLLLVGTGPLEEKIKNYIKNSDSGIGDKVKMTGFLKGESLKKVMKDAIFHVLPSECYENGPYSVLEMMAMGKATIASDIGGLRDYVENKKTGLLFGAGNTEELASCIQYLIEHRDFAMELGKNARMKVEKDHSKESYYNKLLPIYHTCMSNKTTKIGMIGPKGIDASLGGVERHVLEIGKRLAKKNRKITVYTRKKYGKETKSKEKIQVCPTRSLPGKGFEAVTYSLVASLKGAISKNQLIHYHGSGAGFMSFIPRIFGKKVVVTIHGLDQKREKWGLLGKAYISLGEKVIVRSANHLIVVSRNLKDYFKEKYNVNVTYIPNGVGDMRSEEKSELEGLGLIGKEYLLFLARLVPEKGCHFLLEAFASLNLSNISLVIAGGSAQTEKYVRELEKYKSENIIFLGPVKGECVKELYSNAILYILPSTVEGLPIGLLESMSSGTCPLVSDIEENLEVIKKDGLYGYVFQSRNVSDLANKIKILISDRNNLEEVGKRAREYVLSNYEWNEVAKQTGEIYEKVLSEY